MGPLARVLHARLRGSSHPVLLDGDRTLPAASLWTGARRLTQHLRDLGLDRGDRVVLVADDDLTTAVALVAAVSSGIALVQPGGPFTAVHGLQTAEDVDARLVLTAPGTLRGEEPGFAEVTFAGLVDPASVALLPTPWRRHGEVVAIVRDPRGRRLLHQEDLLAAVTARVAAGHPDWDADDPASRPSDVVESTLPWTGDAGAAGLLDCLAGLVAATVIVRGGDAAPERRTA